MAQTLEYNGAVTGVAPVPVLAFDDDLDIIQKLDDEPNDVGGLTAAQLKETFDLAGNRIKGYINDELIPAVLADGLTEEVRANAEAERVANEQERVGNETSRLSAEVSRAEAETARKTEEQKRVTAEANRANAEGSRAEGETARRTAEVGRQEQEAQRTSAETTRKNNETGREEAERTRAAAETARNAAETGRANAEAARALAEQARENAEQSRVNETEGVVAQARDAAKSWAVGGTGQRPDEERNNAKYWADQAAATVSGVVSFNGRSGRVDPKEGDYTADMVGAVPTTEKGAAGGVASLDADGQVPIGQLAGVAPYTHSFTAGDWTEGTTECTITIPAATHKKTGSLVVCAAFMLIGGRYQSGVWATEATYATISDNGDIVLHYPDSAGYAGAAVLTIHAL